MPTDDKDIDQELFLESMGDVARLKTKPRVDLDKSKVKSEQLEPGLSERRRAAQAVVKEVHDPLTGDFVEAIEPTALLEFKRPGIQNGVYRTFRLGKYDIDARLDLHGLTVDQARQGIVAFVADCVKHDIRCALITHGKGIGRQPQPGLLKSCVAHWLPQIAEVMAFHSAQKHHGGVGATYVMIRKSAKKRLENQLRHQKKRS
jgi:DNA-nicking Smr family endonuclease